MRVAQRMISRNYRRQVNSALKKQADTLERSESGLAFKNLSDDVAAGSRAMHLQEERYQANQQLENTKDLIAEMKSVDSNMDSIHSVLQKLQERILMGMSEDYGASAREVISKEVASKKEQLLQFVNNQFGGKYLFAGTNNSAQPFTENADGKLAFNGIPVEDIYKNTTDGKYYYEKDGIVIGDYKVIEGGASASGGKTYVDGKGKVLFETDAAGKYTAFTTNGVTYRKDINGDYKSSSTATIYRDDGDGLNFTANPASEPKVGLISPAASPATKVPVVVPNSGDTYADIGLGLKISSDMDADPRTAFKISFSGLTLMGYGGDDAVTPIIGAKGTEVAGNVYDLLTQIENALYSKPNGNDPGGAFDKAGLDDMFTQLVNLTDKVGMTRTDLGNRMEYLELTESRLEDDIQDMTNLETDLISSDPAQEAIKMKECEYVWLAVMQLGSKVLPASLLDFIS